MTSTLSPLLLALASLAPAASGDDALPGRGGDYQFAGTASVEGTVWKGETGPGHQIFIVRFERGGTLCYTSPSGTWRNGTWKQTGNAIYLEMNKRYAEYRGVMRGDRITGEGGNIANMQWTWEVKRAGTLASDKTPPLPADISPPPPRNIRPFPLIGRDPAPGPFPLWRR
jgi:hypothetical protein